MFAHRYLLSIATLTLALGPARAFQSGSSDGVIVLDAPIPGSSAPHSTPPWTPPGPPRYVIDDSGNQLAVYPAQSQPSPDAPGKFTTLFAYDNQGAGNMFDLTPKVNLQLTGMDLNLGFPGATCVIAVWFRTGSYIGHESSGVGWYLAALKSVDAAGPNLPTHVDLSGFNETFSAFQTYGVYVDLANAPNTPATVLYTNGATTIANQDMDITFGASKNGASFTGNTFSPRIWNGTLYYNNAKSAEGSLIASGFSDALASSGAMFDIIPKRNLSLTGVDINTPAAGKTCPVDVYYRTGSHVGFESNRSGWTRLGSAQVTTNGFGVPTFVPLEDNPVTFTAGQTYGIYVDLSNAVLLGAWLMDAFGPVTTSNADVIYNSGVSKEGLAAFTGGTYPNESFGGALHYVTSGHNALTANPFSGGNGAAGNMFDIAPKYDLSIEGFDLNLSSTQPSVGIDVYYRNTSYVGHEDSSAGWTLLSHQTVTAEGTNAATFIDISDSFAIFQGGHTYGMYIALSSYAAGGQIMNYTNGSAVRGDSNLAVSTGIGKGDPLFTGATFSPRDWNGRIFYKRIESPETFCWGKTNSLGCIPAIDWDGVSSASATSGFLVQCRNVRSQKNGLLFYRVNGSGTNTPFQGGVLCVGSSAIKRTPSQNSGGLASGDNCTGAFQIDLNKFAHGLAGGNPDAGLKVPGNRVLAQWWGRDPGFPAPNNSMLSDGMIIHIEP